MKRTHISLTEAKQHLGELVKRAAYGGETIVLEFRGKPQAAIISIDDLDALDLEAGDALVYNRDKALQALDDLKAIRERQAPYNAKKFDVVEVLRELRYPKDDDDPGLR